MDLPPGCEPACRGCFHRNIPLEASLAQKETYLKKNLAPWADCFVESAYLPWEEQLAYRDKVCLPAEWRDNRWVFGMRYKDQLVPIPDCPVHTQRVRQTYKILQRHLPGPEMMPLVFYVQSGAQVVLVVKAESIPGLRWPEAFFRELLAAGNDGIWLHLNPAAGNKVFTKSGWQFLFGKQLSLSPLKLFYGPSSFANWIPGLFLESITETLSFFQLQAGDGVIDLYSGTGAGLVAWTRSGASAIGVEISNEAVECARLNLNGTLVLRGKCSERLPQLNEWIEYRAVQRRLLFTNPPRSGMETEVLDWIVSILRPEKVAYRGCNAASLRRDLEALTAGGYRVERIRPFDFFPRTHHIETLTFLTRCEE